MPVPTPPQSIDANRPAMLRLLRSGILGSPIGFLGSFQAKAFDGIHHHIYDYPPWHLSCLCTRPEHRVKNLPRQTNSDPAIPPFLRAAADGLLLSVKLQPRASANEIIGPMGAELRIKVTAPPVDAAANEALLRLLAEILACHRSQLKLVRGHTSR